MGPGRSLMRSRKVSGRAGRTRAAVLGAEEGRAPRLARPAAVARPGRLGSPSSPAPGVRLLHGLLRARGCRAAGLRAAGLRAGAGTEWGP